MLTERDFKLIEKEASRLYSELEYDIIEEIAERIANVGYANTVVYNNAVILQEMGVLYKDIINMVAEYNEASASQIREIFEKAGIKTLKRDDSIYKMAGLNPQGLNNSMQQVLNATVVQTNNNLSNLVRTTASTSQIQFIEAMNTAYMEVSTGVKSYSESIIDTVKKISKNGAYIQYPSGQHRSIESATRMNILTSVNQMSGRLQLLRADEMGWDLMELSAHSGARPEHVEWQGKVVSLSGQKGYLSLDDIGYGEPTGFQGVNCRHTWFPYYKGSTLTYSNKELRDLKNETVEYNGKKISKYEATQIQRKIERQIRQNKKDIAGLQGILTSNNKDDKLMEDTRISLANTQMKLKQNNSILNDFVEQTGLKKDTTRLAVGKIKDDVPEFKRELSNSLKKMYSKKELKQIANETNIIANKYTSNESKWKGTIVISNRKTTAKLWSCKIELETISSPHEVLHEHLHAHSISYYGKKTYKEYRRIEEATVELYAKEISKKEKIINTPSKYDEWVDNLRKINKKLNIEKNDFDFAKKLFDKPVDQRLDFLENKVQEYVKTATIDDIIEINKLIGVFYGK